jgi:hypothetical protein
MAFAWRDCGNSKKKLHQDSQCTGRDLNPGLTKYEGVLNTLP